jgi:hypothetical protein
LIVERAGPYADIASIALISFIEVAIIFILLLQVVPVLQRA